MKFLLIIILSLFSYINSSWQTDFEAAKKEAQQKHELILLNFSGSDWCSPCIQLKKTIFESDDFKSFADSSLVLVNADFPRLKKNKLSLEQTRQNEKLADQYNKEGNFPYTLLIRPDGKILKTWNGLPPGNSDAFVHQLKEAMNARH